MESLYRVDNDAYNDAGQELGIRSGRVSRSIFYEYIMKGYSIRDIAGIMRMSITDIEASVMLSPQLDEEDSAFFGLDQFIRDMYEGKYGELPKNVDKKITLIKAYRQISGCQLKTARDEVYRIIGYDPDQGRVVK